MKYRLSIIFVVTVSVIFTSCASDRAAASGGGGTFTDTASAEESFSALLGETPDGGDEYIDSFVFFGESTTYHLKSRGVLSGGKNTCQVWAPENGTVNLDASVTSLKIVYPETGEKITVGEAVRRKRPKRILLTFGLNGAVSKIKAGEEYFRSCYLSLIDEIRLNSPETAIILQSCFPIAESMDMSNYSVSAATLSEYIATLNLWSLRLAEDEHLGYLNTAEALVDERGFLFSEYDAGDGHHLTTAAYLKILEYIRTHREGI